MMYLSLIGCASAAVMCQLVDVKFGTVKEVSWIRNVAIKEFEWNDGLITNTLECEKGFERAEGITHFTCDGTNWDKKAGVYGTWRVGTKDNMGDAITANYEGLCVDPTAPVTKKPVVTKKPTVTKKPDPKATKATTKKPVVTQKKVDATKDNKDDESAESGALVLAATAAAALLL